MPFLPRRGYLLLTVWHWLEPALEWAAAVAKVVTAAAALLASSPWQPPSYQDHGCPRTNVINSRPSASGRRELRESMSSGACKST